MVWLLNDASQILPRPTLVAIATKFGSKLLLGLGDTDRILIRLRRILSVLCAVSFQLLSCV